MIKFGKRRAPLWARLGVGCGCLLLIPGAGAVVAGPAVHADRTPAGTRTDLAGPLNILLVGIDPRDDHTAPLARPVPGAVSGLLRQR